MIRAIGTRADAFTFDVQRARARDFPGPALAVEWIARATARAAPITLAGAAPLNDGQLTDF